jgi:SNF2 family DNA or RNA helicase
MAALIKPYPEFEYLPHQTEGIHWMLGREAADAVHCRGGILADDMGLGKTWQTIGLLVNAPMAGTLIVVPPVLVSQWEAALSQTDLMHATFKKGKWVGSAAATVYLITYNRLQQNLLAVRGREWDRVVLDEGHYIRNSATMRHKALASIVAARRWILSGTPVQNKASDFTHLAEWLGCDTLGGRGAGRKAGIKALAADIVLRRTMTLLGDLLPPAPTHYRHDCPFETPEEKRLFTVLVGRLEDAIERNCPSTLILERYLRIQQFSSHPQLYYDAMRRKFGQGIFTRADWDNQASKIAGFERLLRADGVAPTLVFTHFKDEMRRVVATAQDHGYTVFTVGGGMSDAARQAAIDASRDVAAAGRPVMLVCQIVAANCGLNLQHLCRVIFYTQHWNPSVIDQAMTRCYRFGQMRPVAIHHLIIGAKESLNIDHLMLSKHAVKRAVAKDVLPVLEFPFHPDFVVEAVDEEEAVEAAVSDTQDDPRN